MTIIHPLAKGSTIAVVAPAFYSAKEELDLVKQLLESWGLIPHIPANIFGKDLLCANSDNERFDQLKNALLDKNIDAVWCLRGGYGSIRLLPRLMKLKAPQKAKLLIGFSDITLLHIFLQQRWKWPSLHGPTARQTAIKSITHRDIKLMKEILLGKRDRLELSLLQALNTAALQNKVIRSEVTGGNLSLTQASLGTPWQIQARNKILLLEDVNERGYEIDRMLTHLEQAGVFTGVRAILFGDFTEGKEPNGTYLINPVLKRFANNCTFPVIRCKGIGHGRANHPIPLGTKAELTLGKKPKLVADLYSFA